MPNLHLTVKEIRLQNLLQLLADSGLNKSGFAARIKTSPAYLSQIISLSTKRAMGDSIARTVEIEFKKPRGWMDTLHGAAEQAFLDANPPVKQAFHSANHWEEAALLHPDDVILPFFEEAEQHAGPGHAKVVESRQHKLRFAKSTLKKMHVDIAAAYCISVTDNSMAPVIPEGATLGIDTGNTQIKDGDIYAIDHAGSLRIKMIYKLPGGGLRLRSFNSEEWPDESHQGKNAQTIRILGRVFWWSVLR